MRISSYVLLGAAAIATGIYFFHPAVVHQRQVETILSQFGEAVATQGRARIGEFLKAHIADSAKIHLKVDMLNIAQQPRMPHAQEQDFSKAEFLTFTDNILYSLTGYSASPALEGLNDNQKDNADVRFMVTAQASGADHFLGTPVQMLFSAEINCGAHVHFGGRIELTQLDCLVPLRMLPQAESVRDPEARRRINEMLR